MTKLGGKRKNASITFLPVPEVKSTACPINKSLLPAKPATTGLQGNPVVLLLYRKPQKSEIFGAASQDGGLLLTGGKGPLALRERRSTAQPYKNAGLHGKEGYNTYKDIR